MSHYLKAEREGGRQRWQKYIRTSSQHAFNCYIHSCSIFAATPSPRRGELRLSVVLFRMCSSSVVIYKTRIKICRRFSHVYHPQRHLICPRIYPYATSSSPLLFSSRIESGRCLPACQVLTMPNLSNIYLACDIEKCHSWQCVSKI